MLALRFSFAKLFVSFRIENINAYLLHIIVTKHVFLSLLSTFVNKIETLGMKSLSLPNNIEKLFVLKK